jgi:hypothetical protein
MSLLPLGKNTIAYGSADAARTGLFHNVNTLIHIDKFNEHRQQQQQQQQQQH